MKGTKKILVTGKDGQIGWELQRTLAPIGQVIAVDRQALDLSDPQSIRRVISEIRPQLIVNAAAYTAVDKAESERELAKCLNIEAPAVLAEEAKKLKAPFIHYSTDYIFDGAAPTPYLEIDQPNPLNFYGETKLQGEKAIEAVGGEHLILRTSWVYGTRGRNFMLMILNLAKERDALKIVGDQHGAPTWSRMIALATANMLALTRDRNDLWGTYHLTSEGTASWYEFAKSILEGYKRRNASFTIPQVSKITTAEYPLPAKRPKNSLLSNEKLRDRFGLIMPDWKTALDLCMDEL